MEAPRGVLIGRSLSAGPQDYAGPLEPFSRATKLRRTTESLDAAFYFKLSLLIYKITQDH